MPNVTKNYGRLSGLIVCFLKSQCFDYLHQTFIYFVGSFSVLSYHIYTPFQKSKGEKFEYYFQMRISKGFSNQIEEINTSFCSKKSEF